MIKLVDALLHPQMLVELPPFELSQVAAEARYFNMQAQLKYRCESEGLWPKLPKKFTQQLDSAWLFYHNQKKKLDNEAQEIANVLTPLNIKFIYLKGAAYHLNGMTCFSGRMMSDIDLLVAEQDLRQVEAALKNHGWLSASISNYDQQFYRQWSQEIPPLKHIHRQIELDVHFNILPKTIKNSFDGGHLFSQSVSIGSMPLQAVLKPHAMLLHSAIHLFYESEYQKGLRDLYDIHLLIMHYGDTDVFWRELIALHTNVGNQESIYLALRYSKNIYQSPIPQPVLEYYDQFKPNSLSLSLLDFCFFSVFANMFPPHQQTGHWLAESVLYLRGHMKRMPLRLLIPHLTKKSLDKLKIKQEVHESI